MPNAHAADKVVLSVRIPVLVRARLEKMAKQKGWDLSRLVTSILSDSTHEISLTPAEYQEIAEAVARKHISAVNPNPAGRSKKVGKSGKGRAAE